MYVRPHFARPAARPQRTGPTVQALRIGTLLITAALLLAPLAVADPTDSPPPSTGVAAALPPVDLAPYTALLTARQLVAAGEAEAARDLLDTTVHRHPGQLQAALALARLDLKLAPRRVLSDLGAAVRACRLSFPVQALAFSRGTWWLLGSVLLLLTLYTTARALSVLPALHHLIFERLSPTGDERLARAGASTVLALPLIWGLGPLGTGLVLLALGTRQPRRGDRLLLATGVVALGLACTTSLWLPAFIAPPDYRQAALTLAQAQEGRLTPLVADHLATLDQTQPITGLVRGLALRRSARPSPARQSLAAYTAGAPGDVTAQIALGNCQLEARQPLEAAESYQRALALAPDNAAATYNQALALAALMRFEESSRLLARAAELDFGAVRQAPRTGDGPPPPLEPSVAPARFWQIYTAERAGYGVAPPYAIRLLLPWQGGTLWPLLLPAVAIALILRGILWRRLTTFECSICARTVCRRCVRRSRSRILCRSCAAEVGDISSAQLARILAAGRRRRRSRWATRHQLLLNWLVPGYGLLRQYRPGLAMATLFGLAAGIMGLAIPASLPALPPTPMVFAFSLTTLLPITAILFSYAAAVGLGLILKERDLNHGVRGHLVPLAGATEETTLRTGTDG